MDAYSLAEDIVYRELERRVDLVVSGILESVEIQFLYPNNVKEFIVKKYNADEGEMDTNGWQYDYTIPLLINDEEYNLVGSGYYGDMIFVKGDEF